MLETLRHGQSSQEQRWCHICHTPAPRFKLRTATAWSDPLSPYYIIGIPRQIWPCKDEDQREVITHIVMFTETLLLVS